MSHRADTPGDGRDLVSANQRRKRRWIALTLLIIVALLWLSGLGQHGSVEGVVILEVLTFVPIGLVLVNLRKIADERRKLVAANDTVVVADQQKIKEVTPGIPAFSRPEPLPSREAVFDSARPVSLAMRPRLGVIFAMVVSALAIPFVMLKLSYDEASFDPREIFLFVYCGLMIVSAVRTRIVIIDGVLWRRSLKRYRGVSLARLSIVSMIRPRFLKNRVRR